jgi:hypothetical protein
MDAASVARVVAEAGPQCRAFLKCCGATRDRMRGVLVECERAAAAGEQTCSQALATYAKLPANVRARMPAACIEEVKP